MLLKIYYIDDEPDLLELFSDQFSSDEVVITTFVDPSLAVTQIKADPPDLLFIDYRLPSTTGDEVAQSIDANIPKILVSGDLLLDPKAEFIAKLSKPFNVEKITEIIAQQRKKQLEIATLQRQAPVS